MYWLLLLLNILMVANSYAQIENKWIVVTTINAPTGALERFAALSDWNLVVVGDNKSPKVWELANCHYLSMEDQKKLPYKLAALLPQNHYARKNIGYLYAIAHGATIIYESDDDNFIDTTIEYLPEHAAVDVPSVVEKTVNPYAFFGQKSVWPRGYPLAKIAAEQNIARTSDDSLRLLIQQGLVDKDPDVDAIFRLTRNESVYFGQNNPLALPKNSMSPFNSQNTVFYKDAFWALYIPTTVSFRVSDIWRGYIMQRLLWDIGGSLCFYKTKVYQDRNDHNLMHDFKDEIDLYLKSLELVDFLCSWNGQGTLDQRLHTLTKDLVAKSYYKQRELELIEAWIEDLITIGYQFPAIQG